VRISLVRLLALPEQREHVELEPQQPAAHDLYLYLLDGVPQSVRLSVNGPKHFLFTATGVLLRPCG